MFCSKCGKKSVESASYCCDCGALLAVPLESTSSGNYGSSIADNRARSAELQVARDDSSGVRLHRPESQGNSSATFPREPISFNNIPNSAILERTIWLRRFLYCYVLVCVLSLWGSWVEYDLLRDFSDGNYLSAVAAETEADASDSLNASLGVLQLVYFVFLGLFFLGWIKAASKNVRQLGANNMVFTPGWSIGWYFVPVLSLWKPYQAMKELWQASENPSDWKSQKPHPILGWWWFFWIVSLLVGNAAFRLSMNAEELEQFVAANIVGQISLCAEILLTFFALKLVTGIASLQGQASGKINIAG